MTSEPGVSREVYEPALIFDHIPAPQSPVAIEDSWRRKMQRRNAVNGGSGEWQRFAPIQFVDGADAPGSQQPGYPGRNDELGFSKIRQPAQGGKIQMIVVIVAEEHGIDAGKILPPHSRLSAAARTDRGERTCPLRPDRIRQ